MFTKEELIRKELRITRSGNKYNIGIYSCRECGKEVGRSNTQLKIISDYCLSCKNTRVNIKKRERPISMVCKTCVKEKEINQFSLNHVGLYQKECNRCRHLRKYGLNSLTYDELFNSQNGKCAICCIEELAIVSSYRKKLSLAVDHNHVTGKVRGLLCGKCNMGIGLFNDDIKLLKKAIDYLINND